MTLKRMLALAAMLLLPLAVRAAQADSPPDHTQRFAAVKTTTPPPLDASLSSPVWQNALKVSLSESFTLRRPAQHSTLVYLLYDEKNLYVGVHAEQAGTPIVASQTVDNAGVLNDDHVSVLIDPTGNGSRYYTFRITARGIRDEASSENARYAPDWAGTAKVFSNGNYNVMMIIPFADIRAQGAAVQRWRMNFDRYVAANSDQYTWAYEPAQTSPSSPQFWPLIDGIRIASSAVRPAPHADVFGLTSMGGDHNVFATTYGNFAQTKPRTLGVDLTYPLSNTLAFVGTLNPDFSNVEQDQTTIAPQQFQRNLTEYRPFFAQGAQYINAVPQVGVNGIADTLFYTPSIGIFSRGLKLEGTAGNNSIGLLNVIGDGFNDSAFGYSYATANRTLVLSTESVFANHNGVRDQVSGLGAKYANARSGVFSILREEGEQNSLTGSSRDFFASEGITTTTTFFAIDYRDVAANFAPLDGYTSINDIKGPRLLYTYSGVGPKQSAIKSWQASAIVDRYVDHSGQVREYDANYGGGVTLNNQLSFNMYSGPSAVRFTPGSAGSLTPFTLTQISVGYKDGTPSPIDASYSWGPFGGFYLQQMTASMSRQLGAYGVSLEYDGTLEHSTTGAALDSQWLRRISLTRSFGRSTSLALGLRAINGQGGYAVPGTNLALSFNHRFANQDQLYLDYGAPAAPQTLHRFIMKYVFHMGGGTGT
jgi:hypothetical protein